MQVCEHEWQKEAIGCLACEYRKCLKCGAVHRTFGCEIHSFREGHYHHPSYYKDMFEGGLVRADRHAREFGEALDSAAFDIEGRSVLELGAGLGTYIPMWNKMGISYVAIEMSEYGAKVIRQVYDGNVLCETADKAWGHISAFGKDIIFSAHWLEHMPHADEWFARMAERTNKQLICIVPVGTDLHNRDHWWYFTEEVLQKWSAACGFEAKVVRKSYSPHEDFLFLFARRKA